MSPPPTLVSLLSSARLLSSLFSFLFSPHLLCSSALCLCSHNCPLPSVLFSILSLLPTRLPCQRAVANLHSRLAAAAAAAAAAPLPKVFSDKAPDRPPPLHSPESWQVPPTPQ